MEIIVLLLFLGGIVYLIRRSGAKPKKAASQNLTEQALERILEEEVDFYRDIQTAALKESFRKRVLHFMQQVRFTSVGNAQHNTKDEVLIACSAIIPIFAFPEWEYRTIREVLLYENHFDENYAVDESHPIMGMVGEGAMKQTMILSLRALREGFEKKEGSQTALHEFIHLIDHADGATDGIPEALLPKTLIEPWLRHIRFCMEEIRAGRSDINPYAATNESEFFSVASEYFFEKPGFLQRNHPVLYAMMKEIFTGEKMENKQSTD